MVDFYFMNILYIINTKSKIFVWKYRGAANASVYRYCKEYIMMHKSIMLIIMETWCNISNLYSTFQ